jgi:hypothetical protein
MMLQQGCSSGWGGGAGGWLGAWLGAGGGESGLGLELLKCVRVRTRVEGKTQLPKKGGGGRRTKQKIASPFIIYYLLYPVVSKMIL